MLRTLPLAVLLAGCGGAPPLDDLLAAILDRMEEHPVADQEHLDPQRLILDEVIASDRRVTPALTPSGERWRVVNRGELQQLADARGRLVFCVQLRLVGRPGARTTVEIAVIAIPPSYSSEPVGCCCATEETWTGAAGTWTFETRQRGRCY